jgi:hypothetical protein
MGDIIMPDVKYKIINKSSKEIPAELYIALLENHNIDEAIQICEDYNLRIYEIERTKTEYIFTIINTKQEY